MTGVWWTCVAAAGPVAIAVALAPRRFRRALTIAAPLPLVAYLVACAIARGAMLGHASAFESVFLQLALLNVTLFAIVVLAMIAHRFRW